MTEKKVNTCFYVGKKECFGGPMKPYLKNIFIPFLSALIGGVVVFTAIKMSDSPAFAKTEYSEAKKAENQETVFDEILNKQMDIRQDFDNIFNDDFFASADPFEDMKKWRGQMQKRMEAFDKLRSRANPFDTWFSDKFGGGTVNDITKHEDDNFVYYDIKVNDLKSTSVNTNIENGYITIEGTIEKKSGSEDAQSESGFTSQSVYKSTFSRTFPLPENIDQNKMEMVPEKDKIILKFPKLIR